MNKLLKIISVLFVFAFFATNVFADSLESEIGVVDEIRIEIRDVVSDATEKGVLGVGETITFTVRLNRPMENAKIHPDNYNEGKLVWSTKDDILFTATYTVEKDHKNQEVPLQLENVSAENGLIRTAQVSGTDVLKTIDVSKNMIAPELVSIKTKYNINKDIVVEGKVKGEEGETNTVKLILTNETDKLDFSCDLINPASSDEFIEYDLSCEIKALEEGRYKAEFVLSDNFGNTTISKLDLYFITDSLTAFFENGDEFIINRFPENIAGKFKLNEFAKIIESDSVVVLKLDGSPIGECKIKFKETESYFIIECTKLSSIISDSAYSAQAEKFEDGVYVLELTLKDDFEKVITINQKITLDSVKPIISLNGEATINLTVGTTYTEQGATATDNVSVGDVNVSGIVNTAVVGTYTVTYNVKDKAGNSADPVTRTVNVNAAPSGGGTRIYPATPAPVVPETTPEEPEETTPVEPQPEENPNTGGEVITPQEEIEPVEETPELIETPVETPTPSGLTGFAGFASSPGGVVTIVGSVLLVIGAVGYFFLLRPR